MSLPSSCFFLLPFLSSVPQSFMTSLSSHASSAVLQASPDISVPHMKEGVRAEAGSQATPFYSMYQLILSPKSALSTHSGADHLLHLLAFLTPALLLKDDVPSPLRNPNREATIVWEENKLKKQMVAAYFRHQFVPEQCKSSRWSL